MADVRRPSRSGVCGISLRSLRLHTPISYLTKGNSCSLQLRTRIFLFLDHHRARYPREFLLLHQLRGTAWPKSRDEARTGARSFPMHVMRPMQAGRRVVVVVGWCLLAGWRYPLSRPGGKTPLACVLILHTPPYRWSVTSHPFREVQCSASSPPARGRKTPFARRSTCSADRSPAAGPLRGWPAL